jgi:hypothetical protein
VKDGAVDMEEENTAEWHERLEIQFSDTMIDVKQPPADHLSF